MTAAAFVRAESLRLLEVALHRFARPVLKGTFEKKTALTDVLPFRQDTEFYSRSVSMASSNQGA
jgi:hypothetical protein